MKSQIFYGLYRMCLYPLARLLFAVLSATNKKVRRGLELRQNRPWLRKPDDFSSETFWFHCASGEFEYAKPVITRLKRAHPDCRVLVTYFSPTYATAVEKFADVDFATPLPWDTPKDLTAFIRAQKPVCLMIARTDTWPELLRQARKSGLPTLLFSATLSPTSARVRNPFVRWMTQAVFENLDAIFCVDDADLICFQQIGFGDRTRVAGDTRYDQVIARLENPKSIREDLFENRAREKTIVCGSTWPEDEAFLLQAARDCREWNFVIVPHEPTEDHLKDLESRSSELGLVAVRYSKAKSWTEGNLLLIDKIGILAELYQKGFVAFVGGSFKKTVHSVMEPLASGALTLVGPYHHNNREAVEFSKIEKGRVSIVTVVRSADEIVKALNSFESLGDESQNIRREVQRRAGKSDLVIEWARTKSTPPR